MGSPVRNGPAWETVIAREVVAAIGAHAAAATPGVVRLETSVGGLVTDLGRSAWHRIAGITPAPVTGTSATVAGTQARLRMQIAVSGDRPAVQTAAAVQRSVARSVTAGTGLCVAGVSVAILDIVPAGQWRGLRELPVPLPAAPLAGEPQPADLRPASEPGPPGGPRPAGGSRSAACAAIVAAVRSVPGLRPASPVGLARAQWIPWDPAQLAVSLDGSHLEVQLAATRLPLPALLEQAAAAISEAAKPTRWGGLPCRLVVTALDAGALSDPVIPIKSPQSKTLRLTNKTKGNAFAAGP
jgi:uncharacterized alkaline shock family protein YloU